jgi:ribose-phosphate pyrophosphokinase
MRKKLLISFPGNEVLGNKLLESGHFEKAAFELRSFPDAETYFRISSDVKNKAVSILCSLDKPNEKAMPLFFIAQTLKQLGASSVELIAPYLAYMRQDELFHPGESVAARHFGTFLTGCFDRLITIDPHLHRIKDMKEIFPFQSTVLHSASLIAAWIAEHVPDSVLIGPDGESKQWVEEVASVAGCPFVIATKHRLGDRKVEVSLPLMDGFQDKIPVLVDDIISTGHTMMEIIKCLRGKNMPAAVCIGIHSVFTPGAFEELTATGSRILTCNTIEHVSNKIDISSALLEAVE